MAEYMLKTVEVKEGETTVQKIDRYQIEAWVAVGGDKIEDQIFVKPCICRPAAGPMPEQVHFASIRFTPSAQLRALLFAEVQAAVNEELTS